MKKTMLALILMMAVCGVCFGGAFFSDDSGSGNASSADYIIAASDSPQSWKSKANKICDGTDDNVEIQAAIDALYTSGGNSPGGIIKLAPGTFTCSPTTSITLRRGVGIKGVLPRNGETDAFIYTIDNYMDIYGGTILTQSGTPSVAVFAGLDIHTGSLEDLGFKNIYGAMEFGAEDRLGLMGGVLRNIYINDCSTFGIKLWNAIRVRMDHIVIMNNDIAAGATWRGLWMINSSDKATTTGEIAGGNCVLTDIFAGSRDVDDAVTSAHGFHFEAVNLNGNGQALNYMTLIRPQSNMRGFGGTKAGSDVVHFYVKGEVGANVYALHVIDGDFEGACEYHVQFVGAVIESCIEIKGFDSVTSALTDVYFGAGTNQNELKMGTEYSFIDEGDYNRSIPMPTGGGAVIDTVTSDRTAETMLETYGLNTLLLVGNTVAKSYELPASNGMTKGHTYSFKKTTADAQIVTIYGEEVFDYSDETNFQSDDGSSLNRLFVSAAVKADAEWTTQTNFWQGCKVYIEGVGGDAAVINAGWYNCTGSDVNRLKLDAQAVASDGGAGSPYTINFKLRYPIIDADGSSLEEFTDIDANGDSATFISSGPPGGAGGAAWHVVNKNIN